MCPFECTVLRCVICYTYFAVYIVLYRRLLKTKPKDVEEQSGLNFTWPETPTARVEDSCAIIFAL